MLDEKKTTETDIENLYLDADSENNDTESPSGLYDSEPKNKSSFVNRPRSNRIILVVAIGMLILMVFVLFNLGTSPTSGGRKNNSDSQKSRELSPEMISSTINNMERDSNIGKTTETEPPSGELVLGEDGTLVLINELPAVTDTRVIYLQPTDDYQRAKEMFVAGLFSDTAVAHANESERNLPGGIKPDEPYGGVDFASAYNAGQEAGMTQNQNPTDADRNNSFVSSQQKQKSIIDEYIPNTRRHPLERFELKAGTIISAVMLTGINSDLPGTILGQISENIYDTATGAHLLIPQGSKMIGSYNSHIVFGQQRILVVWSRIIYPDGSSLNIGGMPGSDQAGYAGMKQYVDNHYGRLIGAALFSSVFVALGKVATADDKNDDGTESAAAEAVMEQMTSFGVRLAERNMNIAPTLKIKPGRRFTIITTKDVAFQESYSLQHVGGR